MRVNQQKIYIAMARAKLDRKELAGKAGLPVGTVSNTITRQACSLKTLGKIAEALEVDVTEIMEL